MPDSSSGIKSSIKNKADKHHCLYVFTCQLGEADDEHNIADGDKCYGEKQTRKKECVGVSVAILNGMVREGQAESLHAWGWVSGVGNSRPLGGGAGHVKQAALRARAEGEGWDAQCLLGAVGDVVFKDPISSPVDGLE